MIECALFYDRTAKCTCTPEQRYDTDLVIDEDEYNCYPYQITWSEWANSRPGVISIPVNRIVKSWRDQDAILEAMQEKKIAAYRRLM